MELKNAEIFAAGNWPGENAQDVVFSLDDLDAIVSSFATLNLAGRVPLKLGHSGADPRDDSAPALGWVEAIRRVGHSLLADIKLTSERLVEGIRNGSYKFCSVELLRNVAAGTARIPWVLDAVALLGASQPAVGTLKALSASLQPFRRSGELHGEHYAFALQQTGERFRAATGSDELAQLREQNKLLMAANHMAIISNAIEMDVGLGRVAPAARDLFERLMKLDRAKPETFSFVSVADWQRFAATQPAGYVKKGPTSRVATGDPSTGERADERLSKLVFTHAKEHNVSLPEANRAVMNRLKVEDPTLLEDYFSLNW